MTLIRCCSITEATSFTTGCPPRVLVPDLISLLAPAVISFCTRRSQHHPSPCSEPALACVFCIFRVFPSGGLWDASGGFPAHLILAAPFHPHPLSPWWVVKKSSQPLLLLFLPSSEAQLPSLHSWVLALWGEIEGVPNPIPYPFTPYLEPSHLPGPSFPQIKEPLLSERDPLSQSSRSLQQLINITAFSLLNPMISMPFSCFHSAKKGLFTGQN